MATDKQRFSIGVDQDLFEAIEDFRFGRRYQSRNDAIVALIRLGLDALEENSEEAVVKRKEKEDGEK